MLMVGLILSGVLIALYLIRGILKDARVILNADPKTIEHLINNKDPNNEDA